MVKKLGKLCPDNSSGEQVFIINTKGEKYQVNFTMLYIWNLLDGNTTLDIIASKINDKCESIDIKDSHDLVSDIVLELQKVNLAYGL